MMSNKITPARIAYNKAKAADRTAARLRRKLDKHNATIEVWWEEGRVAFRRAQMPHDCPYTKIADAKKAAYWMDGWRSAYRAALEDS
jgi:ribosome modulation factor